MLYPVNPELGRARVCIDDTEDENTRQLFVNAFVEMVSSIPDNDADGEPDNQDGDPYLSCTVTINHSVWNPFVTTKSQHDCVDQANDAGINTQTIYGNTWLPVKSGQNVQASARFDTDAIGIPGPPNYFHQTPIWKVP